MAVDTKINLYNGKAEQFSGEILSLSGCTYIYGNLTVENGATLSILPNAGTGKVLTSNSGGTATWQTSSGGAVTGATNGLSLSGKNVCLGGLLTNNVVIGATGSTNNFSILGLHVCQCMNNATDCYRLDVNMPIHNPWSYNTFGMSQCCAYIRTASCDFLGKLSFTGDTFNLDFRIGTIRDYGSHSGLTYASDYSSTFVNNSLVSKYYVDNKINTLGWSNASNCSTALGCGTPVSTCYICANTLYGVCAGATLCPGGGYGNVAVGTCALKLTIYGNNNVAVGICALNSNTGGAGGVCGSSNIAIGTEALYANTNGFNNIAINYQALCSNLTGCHNIAIGCQALCSNLTGCHNIAIGTGQVLGSITTGCGNIAIGNCALNCASTTSNQIAIGNNAMSGGIGSSAGIENVGIGTEVLMGNFYNSSYNTAVGNCTLRNSQCYGKNTAIGWGALYNTYTGCGNVAIGYMAGFVGNNNNKLYIANNSGNTLIYGDFAASAVTLNSSVCIGVTPANGTCSDSILVWNSGSKLIKKVPYSSGGTSSAGIGWSNATNGSTVAGCSTILSGGSLCENTIFGVSAGVNITTGKGNTAIGWQTLNQMTCGCCNVAIGYSSLQNNINGSYNVAIGSCAGLAQISGCSSIFIGHEAGVHETRGCRLYISNSCTVNPLIYGEFDNNLLKINGRLVVTGCTCSNNFIENGVCLQNKYLSITSNIIVKTGTTYAVQACDCGRILEFTNTGATSIFLPTGLTSGFQIDITNVGGGNKTFCACTNSNLHSLSSKVILAGAYNMAGVYQRCTNHWVIAGNLC